VKDKWQDFEATVKEIYSLRSAAALLGWDQETMMPPRGGEGRALAFSSISKVIQEKYCMDKNGDLISEFEMPEMQKKLNEWQQGLVREFKKDRERYLKIPLSLTEEMAKTSSLTQQIWAKARPNNDTAAFNPMLKKMLELTKQQAECIGYEDSPYDAMLDIYESNTKSKDLVNVFEEIKNGIVPLIQKIKESGKNLQQQHQLEGVSSFPIPSQKMFNEKLVAQLTFNLRAGRLDESAHPFTEGIWPGDVRLTTRYDENDIRGGIFSSIHEAGHGLYEQGFLPEHYGTPMAEAVSLGIHESQSRLWENQVGRSKNFWKYFFPKLRLTFPEQLKKFSLDSFYSAINIVEPGLIRVDADEVTYNLHVILRFELERALFEGNLAIEDIETAWNEKSKQMLGISSPDAAGGYMQDVHWSCGLFGYFPTYALGNLYSAQIYNKLEEDLPNLNEQVSHGDFANLREWLRKQIHQYGRLYSPPELIQKVTGQPLSAKYFNTYINSKYSEIYGLN